MHSKCTRVYVCLRSCSVQYICSDSFVFNRHRIPFNQIVTSTYCIIHRIISPKSETRFHTFCQRHELGALSCLQHFARKHWSHICFLERLTIVIHRAASTQVCREFLNPVKTTQERDSLQYNLAMCSTNFEVLYTVLTLRKQIILHILSAICNKENHFRHLSSFNISYCVLWTHDICKHMNHNAVIFLHIVGAFKN